MVILENIDIDIDINKAILQNIDIDKISNLFKFGISNRARYTCPGYFNMFHVGPPKSVLSKLAVFCCFWAKIGGSLTRERLVKMNFFIN